MKTGFSYKVAQSKLIAARMVSIRKMEQVLTEECNMSCTCGTCHTECRHCKLYAVSEALRNIDDTALKHHVKTVGYK